MHLIGSWLPPVFALVLLMACRHAGELTLRSGIILTTWYVVGLWLQLFGKPPWGGVIGLVLLVILAIYLIIKLKTGY